MNFSNASIKHKLILLIVLVSMVVMLLVAGVLLAIEVTSFRQSLLAKTSALADVLAVNCRQGLMLKRKSQVESVLFSLASEPHIRAAFVFRSGKPFAHYLNASGTFRDKQTALSYSPCDLLDQAPATLQIRSHFRHSHLGYVQPIFLDGQLLGQIYIQSDLGELESRLVQFAGALVGLLIFSGLLAVILALRLQRVVTDPLLELSRLMDRVSSEGDFSLRARPWHADEIGQLVQQFNQMLDQLQERDQQLEDIRRDLEKQVVLRTSELSKTNRQLEETVRDLAVARDRAEAASRAKSQFLANMSHEIRTPMIGVLGMTELLFNTGLDDKQQQLAQTVFKSGEALLEILNDLLDLSKIEAGRLVLVEDDFDLFECLEEVVELFRETARSKALRLDLQLDRDIPTDLRGDAGRLRQVMLNLVGNAVKFTEEGGVWLKVSLLEDGRENVWLRFEVEDTGIGIAPAVQSRVFDTFAQADEAMNRHFSGTGLGLAIVRQLVQLMQGRVGVESRLGQGSCFWVELPFARQSAGGAHAQPLLFYGQRALLVADEPALSARLREKLTAAGLEVEQAANGRQALAQLARSSREEPFAVAFLEYDMAGLGGARLAAAIRKDARLAGLPLVMVCNQDDSPLEEGGQETDMTWLYRPIGAARLAEALSWALGRQPSSGAEAPDPVPWLRSGWRILLVEDNPTTRDFVQRILGDEEGQLLVAHHGGEALELLEEQPVDLVLMDCQMPVVDGFQATRALRSRGFSAPIIALTANAFPENIEACHAAGMNGHLCKPFHRADLLRILANWLGTTETETIGEAG